MTLEKYSMGIGDRFGQMGKAQLQALIEAEKQNECIIPVWNKSHREHTIVGTRPEAVRMEAANAVQELNWNHPYHIDADHIQLHTVEEYLSVADYFTLDVADTIGTPPEPTDLQFFLTQNKELLGTIFIPGIEEPFYVELSQLEAIGKKYVPGIKAAGQLYTYIAEKKGSTDFIIEISMDETDTPQTPLELLFILSGLAMERIPIQAIAPKFTGRFNKGVDYEGDVHAFQKEYQNDLAIIQFAIQAFNLPANLKMSIHSGSDKFSIYPIIYKANQANQTGVHLKTAGTTWLEEVRGLALSGSEGLAWVKSLYAQAFERYEELTKPYQAVIGIQQDQLPEPSLVHTWDEKHLADTILHNPKSKHYNKHIRQLLHIGYKIAAEAGSTYLALVEKNADVVSACVTENLLNRHIHPLFLGK